MKTKYLLFILTLFVCFVSPTIFAQSPNWLWAHNATGSRYDFGTGIAVDASGNTYVTGFFNSASLILGNDTLFNANQSTPYSYDIFIVKYDAAGNEIWAKRAGGPDDDAYLYYEGRNNIAVDAHGNIYITGTFRGASITFGSFTVNQYGNQSGNGDMFIAKYDSSGIALWASGAGGYYFEESYAVTTDLLGNVFVTGYFDSPTISFGSFTLNMTGQGSMFVVKYDSLGVPLWAVTSGVQANQAATGFGIATDGNNNVYVTGDWSGFSTTFGTITTNSITGWNIFTAKLNPAGNWIWVNSTGCDDYVYSRCISADASGNVYVAGTFHGNHLNFDNDTLSYGPIFIVKFDSSGNEGWAFSAPGNTDDLASGICNDLSGNTFLTGSFFSSITFGNITLTSNGIGDNFIVKLDSTGITQWAISAGGYASDYGSSIAYDSSGFLVVTGGFRSPVLNLGSMVLNNSGAYPTQDLFVAKVGGLATSTNEIGKSDRETSFYPNPASDHLTIVIESVNKKNKVFITDITGKIIYSAETTGIQNLEVSTKDFSNGLYFVTVQSQDFFTTGKFIVQK